MGRRNGRFSLFRTNRLDDFEIGFGAGDRVAGDLGGFFGEIAWMKCLESVYDNRDVRVLEEMAIQIVDLID